MWRIVAPRGYLESFASPLATLPLSAEVISGKDHPPVGIILLSGSAGVKANDRLTNRISRAAARRSLPFISGREAGSPGLSRAGYRFCVLEDPPAAFEVADRHRTVVRRKVDHVAAAVQFDHSGEEAVALGLGTLARVDTAADGSMARGFDAKA